MDPNSPETPIPTQTVNNQLAGSIDETKVEEVPMPDELPPMPGSVQQKSNKKGKGKLVLLGGVFITILLIIAALIAFFMLRENDSQTDNNSKDDTEEEDISEEEDTDDDVDLEEEEDTEITQIAYLKDSNVWIINEDGTGMEEITSDGNGDSVRYTDIDWKENNMLSYSKCDGECAVFTYDLDTSTETLAHSAIPFTNYISDITWSHDGTKLGYIFEKGDNSWEAAIVEGTSSTTIKMFGIPPARGGGYNDGLEFIWSPNDQYVIALNTISTPTTAETVVLAKADGTIIEELEEAFFPTFDGNDAFYYKQDNKIKRYNRISDTHTNVLTFDDNEPGYNLMTSPSLDFISFWSENYTSGQISLFFHDTAGSPALISEDVVNAKWLSDEFLVAIETTSPVEFVGYESLGLVKVNRVGGAITVLDDTAVYDFEIEM